MTSKDEMNTASERSSGPDMQVNSRAQAIEYPSVEEILSETTALPPRLPTERTDSLPAEEQASLLESLQKILKILEAGDAGVEAVQDVRLILDKLWKCNSDLLLQVANLLANGSRNRKSVLNVLLRKNGV